MLDLAKVDSTNIDAVMTGLVTAWSGFGFVRFKPSSKIPLDAQVAPFAKVLGYGLIGLAGYQLWRSYMLWKK